MKAVIIIIMSVTLFTCSTVTIRENVESYDTFIECYHDCKKVVRNLLRVSGYTNEQIQKADIPRSCVDICTYIIEEQEEESDE